MNGDDYTREGAAEMRDGLAKAEAESGCTPTDCSVPVAWRHRTPGNDQFLCIEDGKCKEIQYFYALRRYDGKLFPERFLTAMEAYREQIKKLRGVPDDRIEIVQLAEFEIGGFKGQNAKIHP